MILYFVNGLKVVVEERLDLQGRHNAQCLSDKYTVVENKCHT